MSLLLLSTACKKEDAEPKLEGDWNEQSLTTYLYDSTSRMRDQATINYQLSDGKYPSYVKFTSTTWQTFRNDGTVYSAAAPYTRDGNSLTFPERSRYPELSNTTITQLTQTELNISFQSVPGTLVDKGSFVEEIHYIRR